MSVGIGHAGGGLGLIVGGAAIHFQFTMYKCHYTMAKQGETWLDIGIGILQDDRVTRSERCDNGLNQEN